MMFRIFVVSLIVLMSICPRLHAQDVPDVYAELYEDLNLKLDSTATYVDSLWSGDLYPTHFCTEVFTANSNLVQGLLEEGVLFNTIALMNALDTLGVDAVSIDLNYPLLVESFPRADEYLEFYQSVVDYARSLDKTVLIGTQNMFQDSLIVDVDSTIIEFYEGLDGQRYRVEKRQMIETIINELQPDYLTIENEPGTMETNTGLDFSVDSVMAYLTYFLADLDKNGVLIGAGTGTWDDPAYLEAYTELDELDYFDLHLYPINSYLFVDRAFEMAQLAEDCGKRLIMGESWLYKIQDSELGEIHPAQAFKRDAFSFWYQLDASFTEQMFKLSQITQMDLLSLFWGQYFFAYLDYQPGYENLTPPQIRRLVNFLVIFNIYGVEFSPLGVRFQELIAEFRLPETTIYDTLEHDGYERTFLVHLPPDYDGSEAVPVVIAMHGGFGSAFNLQETSLLSDTADSAGFIVVYPEGVPSPVGGIRTWNAGGCCGYAAEQNIDDVGFINTLIDTLSNRYAIDPVRIYATGMSNGSMMSYRLACELSDRIAAIAPVAGSMRPGPNCEPERAMPIIHFHSFLDENAPFEGGIGNGVSDFYHPPVDSVLNFWSDVGNCQTENDTVYHGDDYLHVMWTNCDNDAEIQLYATYDGGHSWPGGLQPRPGADPPSEVIDANPLMWEFFQRHPLSFDPVDVDPEIFQAWHDQALEYDVNGDGVVDIEDVQWLITHGQFTFDAQTYPNPFNAKIAIQFFLPTELPVKLNVYDIQGRLIKRLIEDDVFDMGYHQVTWDGTDQSGRGMSSGVYFYQLETTNFNEVERIILLR